MHIHIDDQESGATLTLCVERETQTCIILRGEPELLEKAVALAASMKVGVIRLIAHTNAAETLIPQGWTVVAGHVVYEKRLNSNLLKGANPDGEFKTPGSLV